jgi:glycosyltransferase 2 family protein
LSTLDQNVAATSPAPDTSLGRRILRPRTLVSFAVGAAILAFAFSHLQVNLAETFRVIASANWGLVASALLVYYLVFPIRAVRWRRMLENTGIKRADVPGVAGLVTIIYLSWFANSIVPAKLGDVYRAYLLRERSPGRVSFSRAGGTIVAERLIDLAVLLVLLGATGLLSFRGAIPGPILTVLEIGFVTVILAGFGVLGLRQLGGYLRRFVPHRFERIYDNFLAGAVESFGGYPQLLALTLLAWAAEASRLFLVTQALGVQLSANPISETLMIVFIALGAAFLTAPPGTPAGLGYVEASVAFALTLLGVNQSVALSVAILDRAISLGSLIVGGLVVYVISHRRSL